MANSMGGGSWVTINGTHVFIQGGKITKGPKHLVGKSPKQAEGGGEAQKKSASAGSTTSGKKTSSPAKKSTSKKSSGETSAKSTTSKTANARQSSSQQRSSSSGKLANATGKMSKQVSKSGGKPRSSSKSSEPTRELKRGTETFNFDAKVNTSGIADKASIKALRADGAKPELIVDAASIGKGGQPRFAVKVGTTVMRITPKTAASLFPEETFGYTSTMDNFVKKYGNK